MVISHKIYPANYPKVFSLGIIVPAIFMIGLLGFTSLEQKMPAIFCYLSLMAFHLHMCMSLTFDGFTRFSRYGLSHNHPILDKTLSIFMIIGCFAGLSPLILFLNAYSLWASPDKPQEEKQKAIWDKDFIVPLAQGVILLAFFLLVFATNIFLIILGVI